MVLHVTADESGGSGSGSLAVIAGGVAGGLIVMISFCIILYLCCVHKRKKGMYVLGVSSVHTFTIWGVFEGKISWNS